MVALQYVQCAMCACFEPDDMFGELILVYLLSLWNFILSCKLAMLCVTCVWIRNLYQYGWEVGEIRYPVTDITC